MTANEIEIIVASWFVKIVNRSYFQTIVCIRDQPQEVGHCSAIPVYTKFCWSLNNYFSIDRVSLPVE